MRGFCILALLGLAGCQSSGGFLGYGKAGRADDPRVTIEEQKVRGRERYSLIEDDKLSVKTYVDRPSFTGK